MWFKKHDRILKIAVISINLVIALVVFNVQLDSNREYAAFLEISRLQSLDFAKNKPFYDCLVAAAAMANENSFEFEKRAAVEAGDECYTRYNR